ncbi:GntR family transcriptional regulator [Streptomyces sp. SHP 1-2]|nr:GntR family transcriptional regulator [Streptomyces sp. SHP 1-2]
MYCSDVEPEHASAEVRKRARTPRRTPREVADELRARIRSGALPPGRRMPTQAELAEEFGVDRGAVRQALRLLQEDGLLTNVSKGSPPRIAEPGPPGDEPRPATAVLGPRLAAAFAAPRVRVDVVCHTAETLTLALGQPLRMVHEGLVRPESIVFRVLLPAHDTALAFPVPAGDGGGDDPVHARWLRTRDAQARVLRHHLRTVRSVHGIEVSVAFRALPFTPVSKAYLLNGEEVLFGHYLIARREEEWEGRTRETYDALGPRTLLFSFGKGGGRRDAVFVAETQKWFDGLWDTVTTDLPLS